MEFGQAVANKWLQRAAREVRDLWSQGGDDPWVLLARWDAERHQEERMQ